MFSPETVLPLLRIIALTLMVGAFVLGCIAGFVEAMRPDLYDKLPRWLK